MDYEVLFKCPFCETDTAGNHAWNCPNNPNNVYKHYIPEVFTTHTYSNGTSDDIDILYKLKQSGKRLKEKLGLTEEDIDRIIKEFRKNEW
jgi:hypothetical protein